MVGFLVIITEFGPVIQAEFNYRTDKFLGKRYKVTPTILTSEQTNPTQSPQIGFQAISSPKPGPSEEPESGFGALFVREQIIKPVSTDFGIVIEKLNANSKIIPDVDPGNESEYTKALQSGVAGAKSSTEPGEPGNLYLFSHSVDAPWNIIRYNAVFYLLRELSSGDRVIIFYKGRRFDYIVFDKTIADPKDISFLTNRYDKPILTLQTCDPPGTLLNRLIVRARLAGT